MQELGKQIRRARKELELTQAQLAAMAGISRKSISQLETGRIAEIGIRKVARTLEILNLELTVRPAASPPTLEELQQENRGR